MIYNNFENKMKFVTTLLMCAVVYAQDNVEAKKDAEGILSPTALELDAAGNPIPVDEKTFNLDADGNPGLYRMRNTMEICNSKDPESGCLPGLQCAKLTPNQIKIPPAANDPLTMIEGQLEQKQEHCMPEEYCGDTKHNFKLICSATYIPPPFKAVATTLVGFIGIAFIST